MLWVRRGALIGNLFIGIAQFRNVDHFVLRETMGYYHVFARFGRLVFAWEP